MTDIKPRYIVISYTREGEKQQTHLVHDTQFGFIGGPKEPSNVLAECWHKEQAEFIVAALNARMELPA